MARENRAEQTTTASMLEDIYKTGRKPTDKAILDELVNRSYKTAYHYISPWIKDEEEVTPAPGWAPRKPEHDVTVKTWFKAGQKIDPLEGMVPVDDAFWPKELKGLMEAAPSQRAACMALFTRKPTKPKYYRFFGRLPDGTYFSNYTPGMLMAKMKTYEFDFFDAVGTAMDYNSKTVRNVIYTIHMSIPAFTERQARMLLAKRLKELWLYTWNGKPLIPDDMMKSFQLSDARIEYLQKGRHNYITAMPKIEDLKIKSIRPTNISDLFTRSSETHDTKKNKYAGVPFQDGYWTEDDLGYAFEILFGPELGLRESPVNATQNVFTIPR